MGGLPARAGEGERFPGTRGPPRRAELVTGQRQGEQGVTRVAQPGDINYISSGDETQRRTDQKTRGWFSRAQEGYRRLRALAAPTGQQGPAGSSVAGIRLAPTQRLKPDQRIVEAFGADWEHGFNVLGLPNPSRKLTKEEDASFKNIPPTENVSARAAKILGISPGEIPRAQLHDASSRVECVLSTGDPNQPLAAFFAVGGEEARITVGENVSVRSNCFRG